MNVCRRDQIIADLTAMKVNMDTIEQFLDSRLISEANSIADEERHGPGTNSRNFCRVPAGGSDGTIFSRSRGRKRRTPGRLGPFRRGVSPAEIQPDFTIQMLFRDGISSRRLWRRLLRPYGREMPIFLLTIPWILLTNRLISPNGIRTDSVCWNSSRNGLILQR